MKETSKSRKFYLEVSFYGICLHYAHNYAILIECKAHII